MKTKRMHGSKYGDKMTPGRDVAFDWQLALSRSFKRRKKSLLKIMIM